jgi:hypothetical protein
VLVLGHGQGLPDEALQEAQRYNRLDLALHGPKNLFSSPPVRPEQSLVCPRSLPLRHKQQMPIRLVN